MNKDKAQIILSEIKQQVESNNRASMSFSTQTLLWMAESLVAAIDEVEKTHAEKAAAIDEAEKAQAEKTAAIQEIIAEKEQAVEEKEKVQEEYFKLMQSFRKSETAGIAKESKGKLLKKWRSDLK